MDALSVVLKTAGAVVKSPWTLAHWLELVRALRQLWRSGGWAKICIVTVGLLAPVGYAAWKPLPGFPGAVFLHERAVAAWECIMQGPLPRGPYPGFAIAVAHIEGDDGEGGAGQLLAESVKDIKGAVMLRFDRTLRVARAAVTNTAEARAHEKAREWLVEAKADMLVWGYILPGKKVRVILTLRNAHTDGVVRLPVDQALEYPTLHEKPFNEAVRAQVIGFLAQFDERNPVAGQLAEAIERLSALAEGMPPGIHRDALLLALNNARIFHGEQSQDTTYLKAAEKSLREMLQRTTQADVPEPRASIQHRLGNALIRLAEAEGGDERLEEAVAAYRAVLKMRQRARVPLEWAASMNNLGAVLTRQGTRKKDSVLLKEAVVIFHETLQERTRAIVPMDWAGTQNNLAVALAHLGDLENSVDRFREALAAYEEALKERTRAAAPLAWATTKSNLCDALVRFGRMERNTPTLRQAVAEARETLTIPELDSAPRLRQKYQLTLQRAENALAEQLESER